MTDPGPRWEKNWHEYSEAMKKRLRHGYIEYGDESFAQTPEKLIQELQEEVLDISCWGLVLWTRFKAMYGVVDALRCEVAALEQAREKLK